MKGSFDLPEFLCIFLATNSFPVPGGTEIRILLSDVDNFAIVFLIFKIEDLFPISSKE